MNPQNLSLFSRLISATPAYWQNFRSNAVKYALIAGALLAASKTGNISIAPWLQEVLKIFTIVCTSAAGQASLTVDTSMNTTATTANDATATQN